MAKNREQLNPGRIVEVSERDTVLDQILSELRAIRKAIEQPRQTAERENTEFLASLR